MDNDRENVKPRGPRRSGPTRVALINDSRRRSNCRSKRIRGLVKKVCFVRENSSLYEAVLYLMVLGGLLMCCCQAAELSDMTNTKVFLVLETEKGDRHVYASDFSSVKNEMGEVLHAAGSSDQINMKKLTTDDSAPTDKISSCAPIPAAELGRSGSYSTML